IFFFGSIYAQTKINFTGKVTDAKSKEPLTGATIYFPDLRTGSATNAEGVFSFPAIAACKYLVEVSHLGYTSLIETIDLATVTQKDFELQSTVIENEGVTVTGVSTATSTKRTPIPVTLIKKEDLFRNIATNLI